MATEEQYDKETIDSKLMIDHDYDGIKELDNPPPAWLMWIFYATIVWSVFYVFYYHIYYDDSDLPDDLKVYGAQISEYNTKMDEAIAKMPVSTFDENNITLLNDAENLDKGLAIYNQSCNVCHGIGSIGANLSDEYWIYGNTPNNVFKVIKHGAKNGMIAYESQMSDEKILQLTSYILVKLKGAETGNKKQAEGDKYE